MMSGNPGTEIFISSDMFFVEVMLEPSGLVKDVKIHHEGKSEQQVSIIFDEFSFLSCIFLFNLNITHRAVKRLLLRFHEETLWILLRNWKDCHPYIS